MTDLVIGMGEVGRALVEVLGCEGRDIAPTYDHADTIHIAYPYHDDFTDLVEAHAVEHAASLVVVHSTVPVGTCDPFGWVHSPVRGRHPDLAEALVTFPKFAGGRRAHEFTWPGPVVYCPTAADTEAAKLWELVTFGIQVRICQQITEWSKDNGVDPDIVYRQFAETHNQGVAAMGYPNVIKPVLDYVPGAIGGHCITENAALLDHPLARWIE